MVTERSKVGEIMQTRDFHLSGLEGKMCFIFSYISKHFSPPLLECKFWKHSVVYDIAECEVLSMHATGLLPPFW